MGVDRSTAPAAPAPSGDALSLPVGSMCLVVLDGWGLAEPGPGWP